MIITCIGPSASGKTTIIKNLKDWDYFKGRKIVIRKEDDFKLIQFLKFILGDRLFTQYKEQKFFNDNPSTFKAIIFSTIVYWFYPWVIYLEFLCIYVLYSTLWRDRVLLSDRYIYDYIVTFEEMLHIKNPIAKFLILNFPKPYLSFYLKISKEKSILRNKDDIQGKITAFDSLHERVIKKYNNIATKLELIAVDSNDSVVNTVDQIKYYIYAKEKLSSIKSLSISGIDGAGKSTISEDLNELCKKLGVNSTILRLYHLPILYKVLTRTGFKFQGVRKNTSTQIKRSFWWGILNFFDSYLQYFSARITNLNSLIIFDRYFYDYLASFEYREVPYVKMFANIIPKLDKSFIFIVTAEKAYQRNDENLTKDYFFQINILYNKIAKEQKIKAIDVNNKNPKEILNELIKSI